MEKSIVYADLRLTVTLSEDQDMILASLSEQEWQALQGLLYLTLSTFTTTRALYFLHYMLDFNKRTEKDGGLKQLSDGG